MRDVSARSALNKIMVALFAFFWAGQAPCVAQTYPDHAVRLVVPFSPSGPNDFLARLIGEKLGELWKQAVVIDNRGGGATVIGTNMVAKAIPDGYTLLMVSSSTAVNPSLRKKLPYNTTKDFIPVIELATSAGILVVHPSSPFKSVADVLAAAKAHPSEISYGSGGIGTATHLSGELLGIMGGVKLIHVPYRGAGPAMIDMLGNRIQMTFGAVQPTLSYVKAGNLHTIAVSSLKRTAMLPDVPTVAETLPGFEAVGFWGIFAPTGTPPDIVNKVNSDIARVLATPAVQKQLETQGFEAVGGSTEAFAKHFKAELDKWADVIRQSGIEKID
jgi:tripartite-type tricarboxylate transporter receptor subunit TctC